MKAFEEFSNGDGTYNGVKLLAKLSGLDEREVAWMAERIRQMAAEGRSREEIRSAVAVEGKEKPWLK